MLSGMTQPTPHAVSLQAQLDALVARVADLEHNLEKLRRDNEEWQTRLGRNEDRLTSMRREIDKINGIHGA